MADSKMCAAIQKESFARMFDLFDERNIVASVPGYGAYAGRSAEGSDMGVRADLSWMEEKCNDAWGTEPWHTDQRNILMKTLHVMRSDIESLKVGCVLGSTSPQFFDANFECVITACFFYSCAMTTWEENSRSDACVFSF